MDGIQRIDDKWLRSSNLLFKDNGPLKQGAKTRQFNVLNTKYLLLGHIKWWGAWRQYTFFPLDSTTYDKGCLRQLADFCEYVTKEHKATLPIFNRNRDKKKANRLRKIERLKNKGLTNTESSGRLESETKIVRSENELVEAVRPL